MSPVLVNKHRRLVKSVKARQAAKTMRAMFPFHPGCPAGTRQSTYLKKPLRCLAACVAAASHDAPRLHRITYSDEYGLSHIYAVQRLEYGPRSAGEDASSCTVLACSTDSPSRLRQRSLRSPRTTNLQAADKRFAPMLTFLNPTSIRARTRNVS